MTVRAVVLREYGEPVRVERLRLLPPGPGEVRVRIAASGVCHTDLHVVTGDLPLPLPMVLGHEGAGVVEAVGPGVTTPAVGQTVVVSWMPSCGECFWCATGRPDLCERAAYAAARGILPGGGTRWLDQQGEPVYQFSAAGTMAEAAVVPAACALPVPADVPPTSAALLGCSVLTGTGAALRTGRVRPGEQVAVFGAGGVGLQVIQGARIAGATRIIAVDRLPERRAMALRLGATDAVDPSEVDPVLAVLDLTGGRGADCAIEAVGTPETIAAAFNSARRGGRAVVVGVCPPAADVCINAFALPSQGKTITGCWYGESDPARDLPDLVEHYRAGRLRLDELVTRRFALEEAQAAFAAMTSGASPRAVLVP
ncbi:MAG TPA: Zn-dependent alcohol dehydrogenase [Bacillota bacterium]|nr:Zn-dependent alcohol dehydrogenase [Bacillota bacterium]